MLHRVETVHLTRVNNTVLIKLHIVKYPVYLVEMILTLSVFGLVIVLIAVLVISYYNEGFENADQPATVADLEGLLHAIQKAIPILQARKSDAATTARLKDLTEGSTEVNNILRDIKTGKVPASNVSVLHTSAINHTILTMTDPSIPLPELTKPYMPQAPVPSKKASKQAPDHSAAAPIRTDLQPQVTVSDTGYAAMALKQKSDLLNGIQKIVHNELLSSRMTQPVSGDARSMQGNPMGSSASACGSNALAQGQGYNQVKKPAKGNPPQAESSDSCDQPSDSSPAPYRSSLPDMSQYIRKDSIPCWGCSLDY